MNRIKTINVRPTRPGYSTGLKAQLFKTTLSSCDVFTGPNGAGKSTRLYAVVAALGGLAITPTDPKRIYLQARPVNTTIALEMDSGQSLTRDMELTSRSAAFRESDAIAKSLIGELPTAWDLSDFASSTLGERAKILDTVARAGGQIEAWDAKRAQTELGILAKDSAQWHDQCVSSLPTADDGATWLGFALEWASTKQVDANAEQKRLTARVLPVVPPRPKGEDEDKARREAIYREQAEIQSVGEGRARAIKALEAHEQRGKDLAADLERIIKSGQSLKDPTPRPSETIDPELVEALEAAKAELTKPDGSEEIARLMGEIEAQERIADTAKKAAENTAKIAQDAYGLLYEARGRLAGLSIELQAKTCSKCGAADPLNIEPMRQGLEQEILAQEKAFNARNTEADEKRLALASESKRLTDLRDEHTVARRRTSDTQSARARNVERAELALKHARELVSQQVAAWTRAEEVRVNGQASARDSWRRAKAALTAWEQTSAPVLPIDDEGEREKQLQVLKLELAAIEQRQADRVVSDSVLKDRQTKAKEAIDSVASWKAIKAYIEAIRQLRDTLAAKAYSPIETAARELVEGATGLPVPYFRSASDYGADRGDGPVGYHDLSESEQRITAACLVYALARVSTNPCRLVLLDGLEVVQRSHRPILLAALSRARSKGLVDNIIATMATDADEPLPEIEGVTFHRLTRDIHGAPSVPVQAEIPEPAPVSIPSPVIELELEDAPF